MTLLAYVPGTAAWRKRRSSVLCERTAERIDEIVDGELPPSKAARAMERHLDACPPCRDQADVLLALKRGIARVSGEADPEVVRKLEEHARRLCTGGDEGAEAP